MRFLKMILLLLATVLLVSCTPSLLVGDQLQSRLMAAFFEPLVGFNPNDINFFEVPMIKSRMVALLGDKYEPAMKLLGTARAIQHEGALYYVASRYAPAQAKAVADAAGMVWNADTNQMTVMLVQNGIPEIFSEQLEAGKQALLPVLPAELLTVYGQAVAAKALVDAQKQQVESIRNALDIPEDPLRDLIEQKRKEALQQGVD